MGQEDKGRKREISKGKRSRAYVSLIFCVAIMLLTICETSGIPAATGNPTPAPVNQTSAIPVASGYPAPACQTSGKPAYENPAPAPACQPSGVPACENWGLKPYIVDQNVTDQIWSPDGHMIAYVKCPVGQQFGDLWVGDWNGFEVVHRHMIYSGVEATGLEDWQSNWNSKDIETRECWKGGWILFMIRRENDLPSQYYGRGELWKIRPDGTNLTQITFTYTDGIRTQWWNDAYTNIGTANWGRFIPGTDLVYFCAHDGNGWWKAYTCNANGTDGWKCISGDTFAFTIGMSPTGNKLLWGTSWYWNMPTTLMASNIDGTDTITLKVFSYKTSPLVLADGKTVLYNIPGGKIGAIQIDGTNDRVVLNDTYANYAVNYNPVNGKSFLMTSNRGPDGNVHIFSIRSDGTHIVQLTDGPYNDNSPIYSPNGHYLMYQRLPVGSTISSNELVIIRVHHGNKDHDHVRDFETQEPALTKDNTNAKLIGTTFDGVPITRTDPVSIVSH